MYMLPFSGSAERIIMYMLPFSGIADRNIMYMLPFFQFSRHRDFSGYFTLGPGSDEIGKNRDISKKLGIFKFN
jgi:hypothetical protein